VNDDIQYVTVLNDDLLIQSNFFETTAEIFENHLKCGVVCPVTVTRKEALHYPIPTTHPEGMARREGWAFTIRKWLWDKIKPIPQDLTTFCGDDWLWHWTHRKGFIWRYNLKTKVYHYGSTTVRTLNGEGVPLLKHEKRLFMEHIK
jgi:hypothetical protein